MVRPIVLALSCVVLSARAQAQACDGLSADRGRRIGYLLSAEASRDLQAYTARVGGAGNALFGGASLGVIRYDDVDGFGFQLGADLGHAFSMDAGGVPSFVRWLVLRTPVCQAPRSVHTLTVQAYLPLARSWRQVLSWERTGRRGLFPSAVLSWSAISI